MNVVLITHHVEGWVEKNLGGKESLMVWENGPPSSLQLHYKSIPRRMKAEVDVKDGHTKRKSQFTNVKCIN